MDSQKIKDDAKILCDEIMNKLLYHMRYKMQAWPKEKDISELNAQIKSLVVQYTRKHFYNENNNGI